MKRFLARFQSFSDSSDEVSETNVFEKTAPSGNLPLVCQPNHIEGMADEDLKKLTEVFEAQNPHKVATG